MLQREELEGMRLALVMAATLVYCEPDAGTCEHYLAPGLFEESPFGNENVFVADGLSAMAAWCDEVRESPDCAPCVADLRDDWFQLIVGAGEPKAPAWAGYYLSTNARILSEESLSVRRMYARHGFEMACKNREPDDNLGVMLGFLGELVGEMGEGAATRRAYDDTHELLARHILPWIDVWRSRMADHARTSFYRGVGSFVCGLVHACAEEFGAEAIVATV